MGQLGFYQANEQRSYPLQAGLAGRPTLGGLYRVPTQVLCDFGCTLAPATEFDPATDVVYLDRIVRVNSTLARFVFRCTAPKLANWELTFERARTDPEYAAEIALAVPPPLGDPLPGDLGQCGVTDIWEGFLVTGELAWIWDNIGGTLTAPEVDLLFAVEPSLVQLLGASVWSLNLAVKDRTRIRPAAGETWTVPDWYPPEGVYHVQPGQLCLAGVVRFQEGANIQISLHARQNQIRFDLVAGGGEGFPCGEIPLFPDEVDAQEAGDLLSGGARCTAAFAFLNGLAGPDLGLAGRNGIRVTPDPDNAKLVVLVDPALASDCSDTPPFDPTALYIYPPSVPNTGSFGTPTVGGP